MAKLTIRQYQFEVLDAYQAGHRLDDCEAAALNGLRAENIRNNVKSKVDEACQSLSPGELLSPAAISDLQAVVSRYARDYRFRMPLDRKRFGAIELEARRVARERLEAEMRASSALLDAIDYEAMLCNWSKLPEVLEEARLRVAERARVVSQGIEDLL